MLNKDIPIAKIHSYNVSVAVDVGINAAVLFYNICYWVDGNRANGRNFVDGEHWTYNTVSAFKTLFPEMSYEQIRNALKKLEDNGYIKSAFLSKDPLDRTKWYTLVDAEKWIGPCPKCICENSQMENGNSTDDNNILNNIDIINTDNKQRTDNKLSADNSHQKAFSKEKVSYKVFSSQSEEKIGEQRISYNYSLDEFRVFIEGKIYVLAREIDPDIPDRDIKAISDIMVYFYDRYFKIMGRRHPILKDDVYKRILLSMMHPPRPVDEGDKYNIYVYEDMIDHFFETDYGKCSGNRTDYKLPYFFAKKVFENLCWKGFYIGFDDPDQRE